MRPRMVARSRKDHLLYALLRRGDARRLERAIGHLDDVEVAAELDTLTPEERVEVLGHVPASRRPEIIGAMRDEAAAEVVARVAPEEAAQLVEHLETDDAVDILGRIEEPQQEQILARLDADDADELEELLAYDEATAAGLMTKEVFRVNPETTVVEAILGLQRMEDPPESAFYVYATEDDGTLVGVCSLRVLVTSRPGLRVRDVMETDLVTVLGTTDQEDVANVVSRYDLVAVPVVDNERRLLGVVDVDDVVDVIREEATEDILKMAGAGEQLVDSRSFVASFQARWRWLMAAAIGGMLVAFSLSHYESALDMVPALAFFMPVVAGMGGNVGTQSSTIVVRGLAVGFVEADRIRGLVVREISLGATLGVLYGVIISSVSLLVGEGSDVWSLALVVVLGTTASMTIAAAVGTCVPLIMDRFGIDPAVSTGPFVTTSVDVVGLLFYFWIGTILLGVGG